MYIYREGIDRFIETGPDTIASPMAGRLKYGHMALSQ
jgi:hypothetical protein